MTLYQGNLINWQITVTIWAPMQKAARAVKACFPDRVFIHAGAFSGCLDEILKSLLRQIQLILKASKIRKNFQFHTVGEAVQELQEFRSQKRVASPTLGSSLDRGKME
jgi:hypothetical protein